jgi:murein DD-endopeptidase MepM/ murein hydrolase activator NlpD
MMQTLYARAQAWVHSTFPERQIYIRSSGRVQFFSFGPGLQATMACLSLLVLGWMAFTSVNVLFKDGIITAKDRRYQQMQASYENRITDLQVSYDELNGALVTAQDRFKVEADRLQHKQEAIAQLLGRGSLMTTSLSNMAADGIPRARGGTGHDDGIQVPSSITAYGSSDGTSFLMPQAAVPQPQTSGPTRASFLDGTFRGLSGAATFLFDRALKPRRQPMGVPTKVLHNPAFAALEQQITRVATLDGLQNALLRQADTQVSTRIAGVDAVMRRVGINPATVERDAGVGGPLLPISDFHVDGIDDRGFTQTYAAASAHSQELGTLLAALSHIPLTTPVHGAGFERTSDFGSRVDPFTHQVSFHPGLDFGGPWGATVAATAPGTVVFAGPRGGYGNMVEIDHGYGIHTRYGHLSSILIRVGAKLAKGAPVGKLGSTGRSTGPHVHYEVWLADVVRDPSRFIEAGRHVQ